MLPAIAMKRLPPMPGGASDPVDEDEKPEPDHVDEVPVPGHGLEREVLARREVALHATQPDHGQHDRADHHVQAVEAGQHEERGAVDAGPELQSQLMVGVAVLHDLHAEEDEAEQESRREEHLEYP